MEDHDCRTDDERSDIVRNIERYGCHICLLEPTNYLPGFAYSVGLYEKFRHPEIICFGLKNDVLASLINYACDLIKEGKSLLPGKRYSDFIANYDIQFVTMRKEFYLNYLGYGIWFYDNWEFPVLQLVWPDKQHLFPWDKGFNPDLIFKEPLLDRNVDFKFYESRNLGIFTTSQVLSGEPILYVYHNDDGDWQFHSSAEPDINDIKLVSLEQIVKNDNSVNEIYHLEYGGRAWRDSLNDDWKYAEDEDDVEPE